METLKLNSKTGEVSLNDKQLLGVKSIQIKMDLRKDEKGHMREFAETTLVMDTNECETELNIEGFVVWENQESKPFRASALVTGVL